MKKKHEGFELIDHTADIGLRIWACDLEGLFRCGFSGFLRLIASESISSDSTRTIDLESPDKESLLVDFFNELLYLVNMKKWLPLGIEDIKVSERKIKAVISGTGRISARDISMEIKAATYHNLKIISNDDIMSTVVVFDT
ncbi:MAG: archease [Elusimicrobia bacterium]|nr:archease [Elusimicrobiota bacterium]